MNAVQPGVDRTEPAFNRMMREYDRTIREQVVICALVPGGSRPKTALQPLLQTRSNGTHYWIAGVGSCG